MQKNFQINEKWDTEIITCFNQQQQQQSARINNNNKQTFQNAQLTD